MKRIGLAFAIFAFLCGNAQAQLAGGLMFPGPGMPAASAPPSTTTWNPADHDTNIVLSNGNLTISHAAGTQFSSIRAIANHSTGKFYHEVHIDAVGNIALHKNGIGDALAPYSGGQGDTGSDSVGYNSNGNVGPALGTIQTFAVGDTIGIAVDLGAKLVWFRTNGGNWNNSGTADPATGTGGLSYSGISVTPPMYPMGTVGTSGDVATANFGATAYANAAPSGFGNW